MKVEEGVSLLDVGLLDRRDIGREVDRVVTGLGTSLGWHYRLDLAWILSVLEASGIPKHARIADAGAGNGVLQFLVAERGFDVLSIDYAERHINRLQHLTHRIKMGDSGQAFDTEYLRLLSKASGSKTARTGRLRGRLSTALTLLRFGPWFLGARILRGGSIEYHRADLSRLDAIPSASVDCVVSISAIEHVERPVLKRAISELCRIVKPGGFVACTTSASEGEDWFHKPSQGWCFSKQTLVDLFELPGEPADWSDYESSMRRLKENRELQDRLPAQYKLSGDNGMPWGVWNPQYLPVGIIKKVGVNVPLVTAAPSALE